MPNYVDIFPRGPSDDLGATLDPFPNHPAFKADGSRMGGKILGVGLVTTRPEWITGHAFADLPVNNMGAWQANVGFIRPLPTELEPTPELLHVDVARRDWLEPMAQLQFLPPSRPMRADAWIAFRYQLRARLEELVPRDDVEKFDRDIDRLEICSENLALGASVESLECMAPPRRYPPAGWLDVLDPFRAAQRDNGWAEAQINLERLPHWEFDRKVSGTGRDDWSYRSFRIGSPEEALGQVGIHESELLHHLSIRLREMAPEAVDLIAMPAVMERDADRALQGLSDGVRDKGIGEQFASAKRLRVPIDPSWSRVRTVWKVVSADGGRLYLALLPKASAAIEGPALLGGIGLASRGGDPRATLVFGAAAHLEPLARSSHTRPGMDEVAESLKDLV